MDIKDIKIDKKKLIIKALSILIGTILAGFIIYFGFQLVSKVFTKAADTAPRDVIISEITSSSVLITWTTDQDSQGVIEYGTSPTTLNFFAPENITEGKTNHSLKLEPLSPSTSYYFQIRIGDTKHDNGGVPWTFTTKAKGATNPNSISPTVGPTSAATSSSSSSGVRPTQTVSQNLPPTSAPVVPTAVPASPTPSPAPTGAPTATGMPSCTETDCQKICLRLNTCLEPWWRYACNTKVNPANGVCTWITPTVTPTPTPSATPTPTP